ncbi:MAG: threonylcarbamoyl-AMP synthase [Flavobacteriales bacterium]|nr:threonylcarbamoyl-AMP synthase [Flavobacteriales bacterium]
MEQEILKATEVLKEGGVILYPTDTVWGLGCDPTNEEAVQKILDIKQRDAGKGLIVLVHSEALLNRYVKEIPDVCFDLIDYAESPLTIIYPRGQYLAPKVMAPDGSVAIRLTKDEFCSKLMSKTKFGLVSTSANVAGEKEGRTLSEISEAVKSQVDYIVNVKEKTTKINPSQIIKIGLNNEVEIIRK